MPESVASGPAFLRALEEIDEHTVLYMPDEFGRKLQNASPDRDSHLHSLTSEVISLYGRGNSKFGGKSYANSAQSIDPFPCPCALLMASSTHEELMKALSGGDVRNGILNRLTLVEAPEGIALWQDDADSTMPAELQEKIKHIAEGLGGWFEALAAVENRLGEKRPEKPEGSDKMSLDTLKEIERFNELAKEEQKKRKVRKVTLYDREFTMVGMHKAAECELLKFRDECDQRKINDGNHGDLWARGWQNALMIAGLLAVGVSCGRPVVSREMAKYAVTFIRWSIECWVYRVGTEVAENHRHADRLRVLKIIREAPKYSGDTRWGKWCKQGLMPHGKALKTSHLDARRFKEVIETLVQQGDVIVEEDANSGGTKTVLYRCAAC